MASPNRSQVQTGRFISKSAYLSLGIAGLVGVALFMAQFWQRLLIQKTVLVTTETALTLPAIALKPSPIGALRVDVTANLPSGSAATYELQIRDQAGQVLASLVRDAWAESGSWAEGGESGTWSESELDAALDLRAQKSETITLAIAVLEHTNEQGTELKTAVPFDVQVYSGAVDQRYLWAGAIGTLFTTLLSFWAVPTSGRRVLSKTLRDSTVTDRTTIEKNDRLVRVVIHSKATRCAPSSFTLHLTINDAEGTSIFTERISLATNYIRSDGEVKLARVKYRGFFLLPAPGSYGFHAEILPHSTINKTTLTVYEDAHTLMPVSVHTLSNAVTS